MRYLVLLLLLTIIYGCPEGPKVAVYVSDPAHNGMRGVDKDEKPIFKDYKDTENFICLAPKDFETVANYCKLGKEK